MDEINEKNCVNKNLCIIICIQDILFCFVDFVHLSWIKKMKMCQYRYNMHIIVVIYQATRRSINEECVWSLLWAKTTKSSLEQNNWMHKLFIQEEDCLNWHESQKNFNLWFDMREKAKKM